jgi:hypothetical protein
LISEIRKNKVVGEWELPDGAVVLGRIPEIAADSGSIRSFWRPRLVVSAGFVVAGLASLAAYWVWIRR